MSGIRIRFIVAAATAGLVVAFGLIGGQAATGKGAKKLKLGKEGSYAQTFKDGSNVVVFTRSRKVVAVWVVSNYKFDGGGTCAPIGFSGALMPDGTSTGPVSVQVKPKSPTPLNSRNSFTIKTSKGNPFGLGGGSITGKLSASGKLSVTARFHQPANDFQGACGSVFKAPKATFKAFKVSTEIG